jgi:hypothetical protein
MKISELLESRPREKRIMYHGTTDTFLKSILKYGLIANPPHKGYGSDAPHHISYPNAIYLTPNLSYAKSAANTVSKMYGGKPIIVAVFHTISSGYVDEDDVTDAYLSKLIYYYSIVGDMDENTLKKFIEYAQSVIKDYSKFTKKSIRILVDIVDVVYLEISKFLQKNEYGFDEKEIYTDHTANKILFSHLMSSKPIRELFHSFINTLKVNKFTTSNHYSHTSKIMEPQGIRIKNNITFRGSNRIIKIYYPYEGNLEVYPKIS